MNFRYKTIWVALFAAILLGLWFIFPFFRVAVPLRAEFDGQQLRFTIYNDTHTVKLEPLTFRSLKVSASTSFFPQGGGTLRVRRDDAELLRASLPTRFEQPELERAPIGDWAVDQSREFDVALWPLELNPPFILDAELFGRSLNFTRITLQGDKQVVLSFRRGLINNDFFVDIEGKTEASGELHPPPMAQLLSLAEPFLRSLFTGLLLFVAVRFLAAFPWMRTETVLFRRLSAPFRATPVMARGILALLFLTILAFSGWIAVEILEGLPHFQDDLCYLLKAKWISVGKLNELKPPYYTNLEFPHTYFRDHLWVTIYPVGWPLLLAIGELAGHPEMVSPLLGAISVLFIYLLAHELFECRATAVLAAVLSALSPMSHIMWGSMLSHAAASCTLTLYAYLLVSGVRRGSRGRLVASALALGLAFCIRPLTAVSIAVPTGLFLVYQLFSRETPIRACGTLLLIGIAGALASLSAFVDNFFTTGKPLLFAYTQGVGHTLTFDNFRSGLGITDAGFALNLTMAFGWLWGAASGWPVLSLTYAFALLPLLARDRVGNSLLLWPIFFSLPLAYTLHSGNGMHGYGPRFYYDAYFPLYVLTARGMVWLGTLGFQYPHSAAALGLRVLMGLMLIYSAVCAPSRAAMYRGYNGINGSLARTLKEKKLTKALVLVDDWYKVAGLARYLPGNLIDAPLVIGLKRENNTVIQAAFPGLPLFSNKGASLEEEAL